MKTVRVLLAACNGEKYIRPQIDSILSQQGVQVSLLVRDDGSTDRTWEMLAAYGRKYKNISVYTGKNKGAAGSFYDLLAQTDTEADYYAFADQDDVWRKDKLMRAVELLEEEKKREGYRESLPLLYAGKVICASGDLKKQEAFSYRICREASFGNALLENICMGCTQVFNPPLLRLVREHLPKGDIMHDWWMYLTAAYFGRVVYDQQAYMLYRQHGNNQVGMQNRWGARWRNRMRRIGQLRHKLSGQAVIFRNAYGMETMHTSGTGMETMRASRNRRRDDAYVLELMCGYRQDRKKRLRLATSRNIYRQNPLDDWLCRLLILIGYL